MNAAKPPIWVLIRSHLAADPRKAGVLAVLFLIMVVVYVRLFTRESGPEPAAAAATGTPAAVPVPAPAEASTVLPPIPVRIRPDRPLVRELTRDPFLVELDRFAPDPEAIAAQPGKSPAGPQTRPAPPEQEFQLKSTITGSLPMAWVNGRILQPGDEIDGFVLERVEEGRVVLRKNSLTRVLIMD